MEEERERIKLNTPHWLHSLFQAVSSSFFLFLSSHFFYFFFFFFFVFFLYWESTSSPSHPFPCSNFFPSWNFFILKWMHLVRNDERKKEMEKKILAWIQIQIIISWCCFWPYNFSPILSSLFILPLFSSFFFFLSLSY